MKIFLLCASCLLLYGCTVSRFTMPNGASYVNKSLLWKRETTEVTIKTNGEIHVKLLGSSSDSDALKAVAAGAAEGTVKGMAAAIKP